MKDTTDIIAGQIVSLAILVGLGLLFGIIMVRAFDISFQNQDRMLCESAKISGNKEYLEKCECFYETEDIKCLQK